MSIRYDVEIAFLQKGGIDAPMRRLGDMGNKLDGISANFGRKLSSGISDAIDSLATSAIAIGAGIAGAVAAGLTYAVAGVNDELERTKISFTTIFGARGVASGFQEGMEASQQMMKMIVSDAAKLPGEVKDLVGIFQSVSNAGFTSGMTGRQIEKLSANTMAMAAVGKIPYEVAAREMAAILEGNTRQQNILYRRLFSTLGTPKQLNQMKAADRVAVIQKEMNKPAYQEAFDAFSHTFHAQYTTLKNNLMYKLLVPATKPLYDSVVEQLGLINTWFDSHGPDIEKWTERVGNKLKQGFMFVTSEVQKWLPVLEQAGNRIEKFFQNGGMGKIGTGAAMLGGARLASPLLGIAGDMIGSMGGGASGLGAVFAAPEIAVPAFLALAVAAVGLFGAINDLTNVHSSYHNTALVLYGEIKDHLLRAFKDLEGVDWRPVEHLADLLGKNLLESVNSLAAAIQFATGGFALQMNMMAAAYDRVANSKLGQLLGIPMNEKNHEHRRKALSDPKYLAPDNSVLDRASPDFHNMNVTQHNTITLQVHQSGDPRLVARIAVEEIENVKRKTAMGAYNFAKKQ